MNHFDVLIVGAGLSGIGAAYHLKEKCPGRTYAILEGRDAIGGTWDLFRYPGIRSDSDMHTLSYNFKPWEEEKSIADGPSIWKYVNETADENEIRQHIRFNHLVKDAKWSTEEARWTVEAESQGEFVQFTCNFLYMCSGYYNYDEGYTPEFDGINDFSGTLVHPQFWPEDLDYAGKRVIVIGSGATALTLVPAMSEDVASITMVQRSPTYVVSAPDKDKIANTLRKFLPAKLAYNITRFKNITLQGYMYNRTRVKPDKIKKLLLGMVRKELGDDYDVDTHFTPSYNPWDQRLCLVPNSDLFQAIRSGKATVVTDQIDRFTEKGLRLQSGEELEADIIITATGLNLKLLGGVTVSVDNESVDFPGTFSYKGMMYSDVPNLVQTFGYINASWTLRADLNAEYVCRLLNHMDKLGVRQCTPRLRGEDEHMTARPWIDDFSAGYMQRLMHLFPKQGEGPWRNTQNYVLDKKVIRNAPLEDGALIFGNPVVSAEKTRDAA
ncbi:MAG TPA: NAD(P)/FAD-dependent oxidoreductase [Pseudomonadales bacterium]|nr:NAD(P)/FAD-dependent oxidoreductase [Pseudomonadales bacterium]